MTTREPRVRVIPFGSAFMAQCAQCGDIEQVSSEADGRRSGWQHQRYEHPTDDERQADALRAFEEFYMDGFCERCGLEGHAGAECPTVTPDLLRSWGES